VRATIAILLAAATTVVAGGGAAIGGIAVRPGSATVHLGHGRDVRSFSLHEPSGVILLYRISAPRGADVRASVRLPRITVPLRIATRPNGPSSACTTRASHVTCTVGEEWCPMPAGTWEVRLEKRAGPAGEVTLTFRVGPPPGGRGP
jgi:hypothetical protein